MGKVDGSEEELLEAVRSLSPRQREVMTALSDETVSPRDLALRFGCPTMEVINDINELMDLGFVRYALTVGPPAVD